MTLSLQAQLGLDIDDNEIFAEEMLDYIHERYSKFGKNTRIVELFDNFLFFVLIIKWHLTLMVLMGFGSIILLSRIH